MEPAPVEYLNTRLTELERENVELRSANISLEQNLKNYMDIAVMFGDENRNLRKQIADLNAELDRDP